MDNVYFRQILTDFPIAQSLSQQSEDRVTKSVSTEISRLDSRVQNSSADGEMESVREADLHSGPTMNERQVKTRKAQVILDRHKFYERYRDLCLY